MISDTRYSRRAEIRRRISPIESSPHAIIPREAGSGTYDVVNVSGPRRMLPAVPDRSRYRSVGLRVKGDSEPVFETKAVPPATPATLVFQIVPRSSPVLLPMTRLMGLFPRMFT